MREDDESTDVIRAIWLGVNKELVFINEGQKGRLAHLSFSPSMSIPFVENCATDIDTIMSIDPLHMFLNFTPLCEGDGISLVDLLTTPPSTFKPSLTAGPAAIRSYVRTFCEARQVYKQLGLPNAMEFTPERRQRKGRRSLVKGK